MVFTLVVIMAMVSLSMFLVSSWIWIFGHTSIVNEDSCVKFGAQIDIGHTTIT